MSDLVGLEGFSEDLFQDVIARSEIEEDEKLREDQFTEIMIEYLLEAGEIDDGLVCSHQKRGLKVNGYSMSEDGDRLDLFACSLVLDGKPYRIAKPTIDMTFRRLRTFLEKSLGKYHEGLEESSPGFDLALTIWENRNNLSQARLFVFTDGLSTVDEIPTFLLGDIQVSSEVWDLGRLYRCISSGMRQETLEIDFVDIFGKPLPCLKTDNCSNKYRCYFAAIPANMLVELYSRFGPRLLERNVRSFLQVRGNVNKGIRKTILEEPEMFLAYNNGISVTAGRVEVSSESDGKAAISRVEDFQIVNGGQTTGSLFNAARKERADLSGIFIPMKMTEILGPSHVQEIAPHIARFANSQNKVSMADFSSNHPFHVRVQELSRTIWAPARGDLQRQTHWYYERASGQYLDDKSRERTPARKKAFEAINPRKQRFTKTDLGKFENTWAQLPHLVSRGAQKNFLAFMQSLEQRPRFEPDETYFHHLIAKAVLFKETEKIVSAQKFGGYRANIVTYTLAWLSNHTAQRIDLARIWKSQELQLVLRQALQRICQDVYEHVTNPPGGANVTEWCKKSSCWEDLKGKEIDLATDLRDVLIPENVKRFGQSSVGTVELSSNELKLIELVSAVSPETWFGIAKWSKETRNLQPWQRSLAFSLGKLAKRGNKPSFKQANQGNKILAEAERLGFLISSNEN